MSLRFRLFAMLGGLILLLLLAQWWWVSKLMRELDVEVGEMAIEVGSSAVAAVTADGIRFRRIVPEGECTSDGPCADIEVIELSGAGDATSDPAGETLVRHLRRPRTAESAVGQRPAAGGVTAKSAEAGTVPTDGIRYSFDIANRDCPEDDETCREVQGSAFWSMSGNADVVARHLIIRTEREEGAITGDEGTVERGEFAWETDVQIASNGAGPVRVIPIPDAGVKARVGRFSRHLLLGTAALLLAGLVAAALVAQRVSAPLRQLSRAAERVGEGALGTQVGAVSTDHDVGRALRAFDRMSERLADLDHANRALTARQHLGEIGEIARGLAHTLRNPLNALGLSLEELAARAEPGEGKHRDEVDRHAHAARRQIRRIDSSIRSFLALASQGGTVEPVDPGALAQDVALEVLQDAGGRLRMDVRVDDALPALVGVTAELRAVVQALVVNAAEASPEGGAVEVVVERFGDRVRLVVADRGPGLDDTIRDRLFTPHLTTKAHGSGMGLFLAHRIATTRYEGGLNLEDREGGGTRAVLVLGSRREESPA